MAKSKKGGYKIVPIGIDLEDLVGGETIEGIYERIEGSYGKPILLSGLIVDGVEKNDVFVEVRVVDSNFVISDVYGYDITIDADDEVTTTEHQSGGSVTRQDIVDATGLVTPLVAPVQGTHELVGIDDANAQEKIKIGDGLAVEDGALKVTASGGTKLYKHRLNLGSGAYKYLISARSEQYTMETLKTDLDADKVIQINQAIGKQPDRYINSVLKFDGSTLYNCYITIETSSCSFSKSPISSFTDSVTEF